MEKLTVVYQGDLRSQATHERSGATLITDAPVDNQGQGQSFSPTDLLCTAAASCMLTIMGIAAKTHGFNIDGVRVDVQKEMSANPRRVGTIHLNVDLRGHEYTPKERRIIEASANACPVMLSLHPDVTQDIRFIYE